MRRSDALPLALAGAPKLVGADTRPLQFTEPHKLQGLPIPEREWGVQDWLPIGCCTGNWGDGGTGKTLLAQQLMTSCATGKPWLGLATMRCRVAALFCEDDEAELHRRQDRINRNYGIEFDDLDDMIWASAVGDDNALLRFDVNGAVHETDRFLEFKHRSQAFGAQLMVVDTAADTFPEDENNRARVRSFVGSLNRWAQDMQAAVLLNLHPSRTGMSKNGDMDGGSTAWSNTVRSRWSIARPDADPTSQEKADANARILTRRKANYASIGDTIRLRWDGGVIVPVYAAAGLTAMAEKAGADATFLSILDRLSASKVRVSQSNRGVNWAPKEFAKQPDSGGFTIKAFEAAMNRLIAEKQIEVVNYGRPGRPLWGLARSSNLVLDMKVLPAEVQTHAL